MLVILGMLFLILVLVVGGERTAKSLVILMGNGVALFCTISAIHLGINPLVATVAACLLISVNTLFNQNEVNDKTKAAFLAVAAVIVVLAAGICIVVYGANLQGFPIGQYEVSESNGYSPDIGIDMLLVEISVMLMVFIGAIIDTALAITSSLYEIHRNNLQSGKQELVVAGMLVGKDILSSTINTLFFIFIAEYFTLFIQFANEYTFMSMINSKEFCQEFISITISGIGCVLIIPVAAVIGAFLFQKNN